eukprot:CAMPEP_0197905776 /NCGR_PEP_ID=MMETSP1439-20131203/61134_1 /TAXON_ID=66791 /ORGANISM="Gonyaulax spinifera, Strain CCMP409" /LENGTH=67 /DNA_ID=CAMNT_0043527077 /DNA_START=32 /DNA_END=232 /DNA_ORIENTATION=-
MTRPASADGIPQCTDCRTTQAFGRPVAAGGRRRRKMKKARALLHLRDTWQELLLTKILDLHDGGDGR